MNCLITDLGLYRLDIYVVDLNCGSTCSLLVDCINLGDVYGVRWYIYGLVVDAFFSLRIDTVKRSINMGSNSAWQYNSRGYSSSIDPMSFLSFGGR
jgi:hypothetical protein